MSPVDPNDLAHNQMDDDGAPPARDQEPLPFRIGIAPGTHREPTPASGESTLKLVCGADAAVVRAQPPDVRLTSDNPKATETMRVVFTGSNEAFDSRNPSPELRMAPYTESDGKLADPVTVTTEQKVKDNGGIVLKDARPVRERRRVRIPADENGPERTVLAGPSVLVGANGKPISATPEPVELVGVTGETLNSLTWPAYLEWRKTKCRPYDYVNGPAWSTHPANQFADGTLEEMATRPSYQRGLEEIDQATLEFIGEVAELADLFQEHGASTFFGSNRDKLIDECGDIFFCGAWALDAWGINPFTEATEDLELLRVTDEDTLAVFAGAIASQDPRFLLGNTRFVSMLGGMVFNLLLAAQANAGLLANSFKKLKYQRREQPVEKQVERILTTLFKVNQILIIANSSVEEALKVNMRKLDARYPNGYQPGQGGGIRTGEVA